MLSNQPIQPKILIIDDESSIRKMLSIDLQAAGYDVQAAEDFESALKMMDAAEPDVVLSDIVLEDRSGIDLLKAIQQRKLRCPVIMMTAQPSVETAAEALRLAAFDYLSKPIRKEALLQAIRSALRHKQLADEKEQLEREKENARSKLEAIFTSLQDALITVDAELRIIEANDAVKSICGFSPQEVMGRKFHEVTMGCGGNCLAALKETVANKRTIKEYRIECAFSGRPPLITVLTSSPLINKNGEFMGAVLVLRDITQETRLELALKKRYSFHNIIGQSPRMTKIYQLLEELADTDAAVLITGASGTGKELVAQALHYNSNRADRPLVSVNCSALSEGLLESELFGHVRGAFTGALHDKVGRFQLADGGTLFLDEIGDISPVIQLKLLRVLQEHKFERVGDSKTIRVDVRVVAATHRDLKKLVATGRFREDLYYRVKVIEIVLPSLAERREDIPLLTGHFLEGFNQKYKKQIKDISPEVLETFMRHAWPGNVRELEHAIEHAFVLCRDRTMALDHLPPDLTGPLSANPSGNPVKPQNEPEKIIAALMQVDWNKAKAARLLGVSRQTLYRKVEEYGIARPTV